MFFFIKNILRVIVQKKKKKRVWKSLYLTFQRRNVSNQNTINMVYDMKCFYLVCLHLHCLTQDSDRNLRSKC